MKIWKFLPSTLVLLAMLKKQKYFIYWIYFHWKNINHLFLVVVCTNLYRLKKIGVQLLCKFFVFKFNFLILFLSFIFFHCKHICSTTFKKLCKNAIKINVRGFVQGRLQIEIFNGETSIQTLFARCRFAKPIE